MLDSSQRPSGFTTQVKIIGLPSIEKNRFHIHTWRHRDSKTISSILI